MYQSELNGWTASKSILRNQLIKNIKADIICLSETHLTGEQQLHVDDYTWIGWNRPLVHVNAPKGSGGFGILFKNELFNSFSINAVDKIYDGILGVKFQHKFADYIHLLLFLVTYHLKIHRGVILQNFCHT